MQDDTITVDCVNANQFKGRVTFRHFGEGLVDASPRSEATVFDIRLIGKSCDGEYSEDVQETVWERARWGFKRRQQG